MKLKKFSRKNKKSTILTSSKLLQGIDNFGYSQAAVIS